MFQDNTEKFRIAGNNKKDDIHGPTNVPNKLQMMTKQKFDIVALPYWGGMDVIINIIHNFIYSIVKFMVSKESWKERKYFSFTLELSVTDIQTDT